MYDGKYQEMYGEKYIIIQRSYDGNEKSREYRVLNKWKRRDSKRES